MPNDHQKSGPAPTRVVVIHGPNLNLLGLRDPEQYGTLTLSKLNRRLKQHAAALGLELRIFQSNHEGRILDLLHRRRNWAQAFLINPGAFTHYSYALRDAIEAIPTPVVEVHLSNIYEREDFRRHSVTKDVCVAQFYGKKEQSYLEALSFIHREYGTAG